jgi:hypothetical protein
MDRSLTIILEVALENAGLNRIFESVSYGRKM